MSMIKDIYKAPIIAHAVSEQQGEVIVLIEHLGQVFEGVAHLDPSDKDFFSEKVGTNIAESRARIAALKFFTHYANLCYKSREQMMWEATVSRNKTAAEVDPTGYFTHALQRSYDEYQSIRRAWKREEARLRKYLEGQGKAIESIKRQREAKAKSE